MLLEQVLALELSCPRERSGLEVVASMAGPAAIDWTGVFALAESHGVLAPALNNLARSSPIAVPWRELVRAQSRLCMQHARAAALSAEAVRIGSELARVGVPVLVLKGPAVASMFYESPKLRTFTDLDVLVGSSQLEAADAVLRRIGYSQDLRSEQGGMAIPLPRVARLDRPRERTHHVLPYRLSREAVDGGAYVPGRVDESGGEFRTIDGARWLVPSVKVELHHTLRHPRAGEGMDARECLEDHVVACELAGYGGVLTLAPPVHALYLCDHLFREATWGYYVRTGLSYRLVRFVDVAVAVRTLAATGELGRFIEQALRWGMRRVVEFAARHTATLFPWERSLAHLRRELGLSQVEYIDEVDPDPHRGEPVPVLLPLTARIFDRSALWAHAVAYMWDRKRGQRNGGGTWGEAHSVGARPQLDRVHVVRRGFQAMRQQMVGWLLEYVTIRGADNDLSFTFDCEYDDRFLYLATSVVDDTIVSGDPERMGFFFDRDAVLLRLAAIDGVSVTKLFVLFRDRACTLACLAEQTIDEEFHSLRVVPGSTVFVGRKERGYSLLVLIPWCYLGIVPRPGTQFVFDMAIADCDDEEEGVKCVMSWGGVGERGDYDPTVLRILILDGVDSASAGRDTTRHPLELPRLSGG